MVIKTWRSEENATPKSKNNSLASTPNSIYASKVLGKDVEINSGYQSEITLEDAFASVWNQQHPVIHTWLILSSVSICFLSALLFIIH